MTTDTQTRQDEEAGRLAAVRTKASDAYRSARERTGAAYGSVRERAATVTEGARELASTARQTTADGIDANPVVAVIGGLALGAIAAAMLPVSRRERDALGDVGRRVNDAAREAAKAAKDAGQGKIDELGLRDAAKQSLGDLASKAGEAARSSATAAAQAVKSQQ